MSFSCTLYLFLRILIDCNRAVAIGVAHYWLVSSFNSTRFNTGHACNRSDTLLRSRCIRIHQTLVVCGVMKFRAFHELQRLDGWGGQKTGIASGI